MLLFVRGIEVGAQDFVHGEHVYLFLFENRLHRSIAQQHSLVAGILEVVLLDIGPYAFDGLWPGHLRLAT